MCLAESSRLTVSDNRARPDSLAGVRRTAPGFPPPPFRVEEDGCMPKKIDPAVKERALRMVSEHRGEYSSLTACCDQVGRRLGLGKETVRGWAVQADIDAGARPGISTEESAEIKRLKAENRRLTEDLEIMRRASICFAGGARPPQPVMRVHRPDEVFRGMRSSRSAGACAKQGCRSPHGPIASGPRRAEWWRPGPSATRKSRTRSARWCGSPIAAGGGRCSQRACTGAARCSPPSAGSVCLQPARAR